MAGKEDLKDVAIELNQGIFVHSHRHASMLSLGVPWSLLHFGLRRGQCKGHTLSLEAATAM